jgi:hypothetical protein
MSNSNVIWAWAYSDFIHQILGMGVLDVQGDPETDGPSAGFKQTYLYRYKGKGVQ